jgi:FdhE protein
MILNPLSNMVFQPQDRQLIQNYWDAYLEILTDCIASKPIDTRAVRDSVPKWVEDFERGHPLIDSAPRVIDSGVISAFAEKFEGLLKHHLRGGFDDFLHVIEKTEQSGRAIVQFIENAMAGDPMYLARISRVEDVSLEPLTFFAAYLSRPIRQAVACDCIGEDGWPGWPYGYCPVCGLWPRLAHIDEADSSRRLWCLGCGTNWLFERLVCPFCMESDRGKLGYLQTDKKNPFRIYTCESCRRYIKTKVGDYNSSNGLATFDVDYLSSSALDGLAAADGYIQDFIGFAAFDLQDNAAAQTYRKKARELKYITLGE